MPRFDVTIAGELNMDLILYGVPDDLPPERELIAEQMILTLGGSSSIVAHNLASLGTSVGFLSRIGDDQLGQLALDRLAFAGVDISKVRRIPGATAGAKKTGLTVVLQRAAWRNMVTYLGTIAELTYEDLDFDYLADSRHFHLSSFFLQSGLTPRIPDLFRELKTAGLTISLDTNDDPADTWQAGIQGVLPFVDVFLPNEREARKVAGTDDLEAAISRLSAMVPLVVVKMGARGALAQRGTERFTSPAINTSSAIDKTSTVDAVGAGDSFNAGFLSQYVRGADLPACLTAGNLAGALSTTRPGGTEAFQDTAHRDRFLQQNKPA